MNGKTVAPKDVSIINKGKKVIKNNMGKIIFFVVEYFIVKKANKNNIIGSFN
tara:strand:+ start:284 stop:439 length:156 start_codon:yes stop_codon:yes gene_type:complete